MKKWMLCCYCTSKTRKSESNSQLIVFFTLQGIVVIALVKLENLKAIHNCRHARTVLPLVVIALVKLENLKAIHNESVIDSLLGTVVIALVKLENG